MKSSKTKRRPKIKGPLDGAPHEGIAANAESTDAKRSVR